MPFFHTLAFDDYPEICSGRSLRCMNAILRDIGSHTEVEDAEGGPAKTCYSPCTDQTNKMAVTTSVFPNLNTFRLSTELCVLFRKLLSTCATYKQVTINERYPGEVYLRFFLTI